nr:C4 protein [Cotton leaf curl Rajasthan virus]
MGLLTCMFSSSSKENSRPKKGDSSTWSRQAGQHIFIQTYRELNPAPTSNPTSRRTGTFSTGGNFRSTEGQQEEDNKQPMTLTPQHLTREVSRRLLESLRN